MLDHQCLISICRKLSCLLHVENHLPHSHLSYDITTNSKLVFLGDSGMPGYVHPKLYNHLVENFCVYLQAKNQLHLHTFLEKCKLVLDTLGMPGYIHPK